MNNKYINGDYVKRIRQNNTRITKNSIIYYWWFKKEYISGLLKPLSGYYDPEKIKFKKVDDNEYGLLYIGQAKNGHDRLIKYHILDSSDFHSKGVQNGRLSSLRQTLCGLININMSQAKAKINDTMDDNCYVEWEEVDTEMLNKEEKLIISSNYLPLNYQHTKDVLTTEHRKRLSEVKRQTRK